MPPLPAAGVPLSTPVVALNVTPLGRVPLSLSVGVGKPVVVTVKLPAAPTVKVVLLALVMAARRLVDREGEGLGGVAADAVVGGEGQGVGAARPRRRGAAEHAGALR